MKGSASANICAKKNLSQSTCSRSDLDSNLECFGTCHGLIQVTDSYELDLINE